ncbi:MAG: enoyl-CoA hydratase/isomerase family protein [Planctomycetes bacterium]|nr:enoyl-CoA hydratase/isomerase family protein [Planctomycetota bacterium]
MIDVPAELFPSDAPPAGACVQVERPEDGLAIVRLDPPHRSMPLLDAPLLRDLGTTLWSLAEDASLRGVVITGKSPGRFAAGADVKSIESVTDPRLVEDLIRAVHRLYRFVDRMRPRVVAAVGGPVPGGAYELCLACDVIVACDDDSTRLGLPETQLGLFPAWGGAHRLPRRIGVPKALDAILTGRLFRARSALKIGMVDRLTKPELLLRVASDVALGRLDVTPRTRGPLESFFIDANPLARAIVGGMARKSVLARTKGHYPAPLVALELVLKATTTSLEEAADKEASAAAPLITSALCKNLVGIFFGSEHAKSLAKRTDGTRPAPLEHAHVIGAGVMGGAIASLLAEKGVWTRLSDLSRPALDASLLEHRAHVKKQLARRRMQRHEADAAVDRLDASPDVVGLKRTGLVLEAVAERLDVKRKVLGDLAARAPSDALLCTNTSSLAVADIAEGLPHPERVVGLHFFNPVRKMPLVEIVRGPATSDETVVRAAAVAVRLGKTPVVVKDVAGFLVNRLLGPYLDEAVRLFVDGADALRLDAALVRFGMPMGPLLLLDEVGLDIAQHAGASLFAAYGERMTPTDGIAKLARDGRLGKKTSFGFYRHETAHGRGKSKPPVPADDLPEFQRGTTARDLGDDELVDRCVLAMLAEAVRALDEHVVASAAELDLATIFGMGFPPFRGGLLRYADTLGATEVVRRLDVLAARPDVAGREGGPARFRAPESLRAMAKSGATFRGRVGGRPAGVRVG